MSNKERRQNHEKGRRASKDRFSDKPDDRDAKSNQRDAGRSDSLANKSENRESDEDQYTVDNDDDEPLERVIWVRGLKDEEVDEEPDDEDDDEEDDEEEDEEEDDEEEDDEDD
jgi:casein kinase II subunit beta